MRCRLSCLSIKDLRQHFHKTIDLRLANDQWGNESEHVISGRVDQNSTPQAIVDDLPGIRFYFDRLQKAKATNVPHDVVAVLALRQAFTQIVAHAAGLIEHPAF